MQFRVLMALAAMHSPMVVGDNFISDSKRFGNPKMDIVLTETKRNPGTSVLNVKITSVGSSVGSSFFIVCSLRDLARQRGNYRYVAKAEEVPGRHQMLVGFLTSASEAPGDLDARLTGKPVVDLEQFSAICDRMK